MDISFVHKIPLDYGPIYYESDFSKFLPEPWNAVSAAFFILLAVYWIIKLRREYRERIFLVICTIILLIGGISGAIYHALRVYRIFFLMDIFSILILVFLVSCFLWKKFVNRAWLGLLLLILFMSFNFFMFRHFNKHISINLSYAFMALLLLMPALIGLIRLKFKNGWWIAWALAFFALALFSRYTDGSMVHGTSAPSPLLPMGTHWLWHIFGVLACHAFMVFIYRIPIAVKYSCPKVAKLAN